MADRKIQGFKKFSEIKKSVSDNEIEDSQDGIQPEIDSDRPMMPNSVNKSSKTAQELSQKDIIPVEKEEEKVEESINDVKFYGKVAKFPKNKKASKAINFLENVKISKNSIWYLLIEKQNNELQMVKYNNKQGFDLNNFVLELKGFYIRKWYKSNPKLSKLVESIEVKGAQEFSTIKNIPNIEIEPGKKLITKITEDLIKLLSK